jgi:single-strand DNA-binding protein
MKQIITLNGKGIAMINNTVIVGRLGQDPELRYFEAGTCKSRFSLAVDRPGGSRENKITDWFNIEAWGKLAEFSGEYLKKGMMVSVQGSIEVDVWTDQTGNTRENPSIKASAINFVGSKRDNEQYRQQGGGGQSSYNNDAVVPF